MLCRSSLRPSPSTRPGRKPVLGEGPPVRFGTLVNTQATQADAHC